MDAKLSELKEKIWDDYWRITSDDVRYLIDLSLHQSEGSFIAKRLLSILHPQSTIGPTISFIKELLPVESKGKEIVVEKLLHFLREKMFPDLLGASFHPLSTNNQLLDMQKPNQQFPYIPSGLHYLLGCPPKFLEGKKFIDIGCGIGDKVICAAILSNMVCYGIEYDFYPVGIGKHIINNLVPCDLQPKAILLHGDAFTHDFKEYDRIYTYRPLKEDSALYNFYKHIALCLQVGTMWLECAPIPIFRKVMEEEKFTGIKGYGGYCWIKRNS